jgi:hypothetical protein
MEWCGCNEQATGDWKPGLTDKGGSSELDDFMLTRRITKTVYFGTGSKLKRDTTLPSIHRVPLKLTEEREHPGVAGF